ncbi:nitroreductase family protein [Streptomyces fragilis]|uniref:Nitroreductase family protein n=1 Tax=Streptomyces fragilis TaxID=67301 RepID=A0ABV2YK51_9ACTN|nr:nitroreductase family protein [Streptomyces fragilis]
MDVEERLDPLLTRFWEETRLRAVVPDTPPRSADPPQPLRATWTAIADLLGLGYGERDGAVITKGKTLMRARTTPSAGALYPFEVMLALRGDTGYELYAYDVVGCCLRHTGAASFTDVAELLDRPASGPRLPDAVVVPAGRPWQSMRKYGRRGYLYTLLDGGHAATNIALAAEDAGFRALVRLRLDRRRAADLLGLAGRCREPQALVELTAPADRRTHPHGPASNPFAVPIWRGRDEAPVEDLTAAEIAAWKSVQSISAFHNPTTLPPAYGSSRSLAAGPRPTAEPSTEGAAAVRLAPAGNPGPLRFRTAVLRRRSAKGFRPARIGADDLGKVLVHTGRRTAMDCVDGPLPALRVLIRDVEGIEPGSYVYDPDDHVLLRIGDGGDDAALTGACMGQGVVHNAALLLVLHAPVRPLLGARGRQGLAELHFHAAGAAQRLCLGAAEQGLGITCLGGFDTGRVADLVHLEGPEEVVYVLAGGVPDESAVKWDRAPVAYSHGLGPGPAQDR